MDPERRNQRILIVITWLVTVAGVVIAGLIWLSAGMKTVPKLEGQEALFSLMFPAIAIALALVACLERPRSGVKQPAPKSALATLVLSVLVILGMALTWFTQP